MSRNLQPGIHPDADRLSVFAEGAATAREQELMLAHLAECGECRKAVFLMQPHGEPQPAAITPENRWAWRWLVPLGLPVAALACGLIAVLIYLRPHGAPATPQQMASVRRPEAERPGATVATTSNAEAEQSALSANADLKASINLGRIARSEGRQKSLPAKAASVPRGQQSQIADLNLPANRSGQASAGAAPQITVGGPITSVQTADSALAQSTISASPTSNLPLNGRNFTELQQVQPADTKSVSSPNSLTGKKEVPALQIQAASTQNETLGGVSGRITDRTGAVIAGVTVTLRDAAGKTRQTTTGADGSFHLTELPAGQYRLTATANGFKTSDESIELKPSEMAMLQPVLDVGAASEVVEVGAGATSIQTESANVSDQMAETRGARRGSAALSDRPILATVSQGKRVLSLDDAGNLLLSRDEGKKWKKIKPRWAGKAVRIESTTAASGEASANAKDEIGGASEGAVFQLTTDAGITWSSKDGLHWHKP